MIETIGLIIINLALLGYQAYSHCQAKKEREYLIKALMAKDLNDLTNNQVKEEAIKKTEPEVEPDLIPLEDVSDKMFDKALKKEQEDNG